MDIPDGANGLSLRESFRQSSLAQPIKIDDRNEPLRAQVSALQYELETLKHDREVAALQHESDLREAEARADAEFRRAEAAEARANSASAKNTSLLRELEQGLQNSQTERGALDRRVRTAEEEKRAVSEQLAEAQEAAAAAAREADRRVSEADSRTAAAQAAIDELTSEVGAKTAAARESAAAVLEKEAELETLRLEKERGALGADNSELTVLRREFSEQVARCRQLEITGREQKAELDRLRSRVSSLDLLREEKRDLESKLRLMDELRVSLAEARLRVDVLEDERRAWSSYIENQSADVDLRFSSPEEMARAFMKSRIETVSLLDQLGTLKPTLATKDAEIAELTARTASLEAAATAAAAAAAANRSPGADSKEGLNPTVAAPSALARLERQRALAVREVDYLRAQLSSLDAEQAELDPARRDEARVVAITEMQALVDAARADADKSRREAEAARKAAAEAAAAAASSDEQQQQQQPASTVTVGVKRPRLSSSADRLSDAQAETRQLTAQLAAAEAAHRQLQAESRAQAAQLAALRDSKRTRVLELRDNPTAQAEAVKRATLDALRAENRALLARVEAGPGSGSSPTARTVPVESVDALRDELAQLAAELTQKEKRNTRRMQVFSAKAAEFREAVASILSWKMDFLPNGRVKLSSMFYPGDDEQERTILFDGDNGTMKVSGGPRSEFASEIRSLIEFWVEGKKEIPCFLAAMTLEFYERFSKS